MRLLFDQNLSPRLVRLLAKEYPGSAHVVDASLDASPDSVVWIYAAAQGFVIVSKDVDFQQRSLLLGAPPKVIWIRLGNGPTIEIAELLRDRLSDITAFVADPDASFLALI